MAAAAISDPLEELARDLEFARELTAGEEQAFHRFYEAYFPRVYGFVRKKLSNRADVEEVVQEVFLNIFVSIGSFRGDAPLAAWVFGVARRTVARRFRRKRHTTLSLSEDEHLGDSSQDNSVATPLEAYECQERVAAMTSVAENDLTDEQWKVFWHHHLEDRSVKVIAKNLKKSEDSIKSNLYRTRKALLST